MSYRWWQFANTPSGKVLRAIQVRGRASIKDVARDLGVTASAVRLHLTQLEASGAIQADRVREGVGRPYHVYSVTPEGHALFHQDYGDLARLLLAEVTESQGPDSLPGVLRRLSARLADLYRNQIGGQELAERLEDWAGLLERRGVPVEIEKTREGYVLQEYGCLYHGLSLENRAACELERQVMARLLESGVEIRECVLDGHHGCRFTIKE